jgi:hypothetical protein
MPVKVLLTPAKRSIYTAGLSYGSTNGAGVRLGVERRYLNRRGHKALAEVTGRSGAKVATAQYRIPAFAWLEGWYTAGMQFVDEQTDYIDNRKADFFFSRSGEINAHWRVLGSVHALRERWAYVAEDDGDPATPPDYSFATLFYPEASGEYINVDQRLAPGAGWGGKRDLRGGVGRRRLRHELPAGLRARCAGSWPGPGQPPAARVASSATPSQRHRPAAADAALPRRWRSQHPRLRLARSRAARRVPGRRVPDRRAATVATAASSTSATSRAPGAWRCSSTAAAPSTPRLSGAPGSGRRPALAFARSGPAARGHRSTASTIRIRRCRSPSTSVPDL